ncbi:MAG TPA: aspartyl/asparaginyl beta-hydroxylase domain-containing protein [Candidatus Limnocylindria bacterium]|nr:aspartyl/asparaginyl beta-hydroxylase domain-containing protein [Candidatus Limnocylindria bacterium]
MAFPDRIRLPFRFDASALAADADGVGADRWERHFNTGYYEGDWSGVALRSAGGRLSLYPDPSGTAHYSDTPLLATCPGVAGVLAALPCPLTSVRFLRLGPGARVREHTDLRLGFEDGEVRLHVPVRTGPGVEFELDGHALTMEPGECWYVDVTRPHRVANPGPGTRVHLVIDCVVDDWLREVLIGAAA